VYFDGGSKASFSNISETIFVSQNTEKTRFCTQIHACCLLHTFLFKNIRNKYILFCVSFESNKVTVFDKQLTKTQKIL